MTRTTQPLTITVPGLGSVMYPGGAAVPERHLPHVAKHQRRLLKEEKPAAEKPAAEPKGEAKKTSRRKSKSKSD